MGQTAVLYQTGAMRGYGIPQAMFAGESHIDDICKAIHMSPLEFRRKNLMPVGYVGHRK